MATPALAAGIVYVGSIDRKLYALDAATGQLRWVFEAEYGIESSPIVAKNIVYVGANDGWLYALGVQDGHLVWRYQAKDIIRASPVVWEDLVFVGSRWGLPWPMGCFSSAPPIGACTHSVWRWSRRQWWNRKR